MSRPTPILLAAPLGLLLAQPLLAAPFQNGSFTSFAGWQGVITDSSTFDEVPVPDLDADSHFTLSGSGFVQLSNDLDYFEVALFQAFDLDPAAKTLSFLFDWSLTAGGPDPDLVQASLLDPTGALLIDLFPATLDTSASVPLPGFSPAVSDVSAYAGQAVVLQFLLQDGDFDEQDWLSIGQITIDTGIAPVPGTVALMTLGALMLRRGHRGLGMPKPATAVDPDVHQARPG